LARRAYNAANNILFITLSLLLSCLILSGVMSWANLRGVSWLLQVPRPLRARQEAPSRSKLRNRKSLVPVYGLWFDLTTRPVAAGPRRPEATWRANSGQIRAAFAQLEKLTERVTLFQRERLDPGGEVRLDWMFTPARRGVVRVELTGVGSLFPFGFLRKRHGTACSTTRLSGLRRWSIASPEPPPPRIRRKVPALRGRGEQRPAGPAALSGGRLPPADPLEGERAPPPAHGAAFAAESTATYFLRIDTAPGIWRREEQFELMCGFAATLAEDLFTEARLAGAAIESGAAIAIRRLRDLEWFLEPACGAGVEDGGPGIGGREPCRRRGGGPDSGGGFRAHRPPQCHHLCPEAVRGVAALRRWTKDCHSLALMNCGSCAGCSRPPGPDFDLDGRLPGGRRLAARDCHDRGRAGDAGPA